MHSGKVFKERAIVLANNLAPLVLASLYQGMRALVTQIKENFPVFGHGPLWIVQLCWHLTWPGDCPTEPEELSVRPRIYFIFIKSLGS